jgi:hypothetical protein
MAYATLKKVRRMTTFAQPGAALLLRAAFSIFVAVTVAAAQESILPQTSDQNGTVRSSQSFDWQPAFEQSLMFLSIQQAYRIGVQPQTRENLKGPYFRDWMTSVSNLRG